MHNLNILMQLASKYSGMLVWTACTRMFTHSWSFFSPFLVIMHSTLNSQHSSSCVNKKEGRWKWKPSVFLWAAAWAVKICCNFWLEHIVKYANKHKQSWRCPAAEASRCRRSEPVKGGKEDGWSHPVLCHRKTKQMQTTAGTEPYTRKALNLMTGLLGELRDRSTLFCLH